MLKAATAHTVTPPDDATSLSSSSAAPRRLKEIPLPTFQGDLAEWRSFWRMFEDSMEDSFSDNDKLCYLKDSLKDSEAATMVRQSISNGDSFEQVTTALCRRFDQPREVFLQATHSFVSPINLDYDLNGLSAIVNELRKSRNTIERYGDKTVDQILTALCELRMTPKLKKEWVLIQKDPSIIPSIGDLLEFAETRRALLNATTNKFSISHKQTKSSANSKPSKGSVMHVRSSVTSCEVCKEEHSL